MVYRDSVILKENAQFVKKLTFEPLMDFKRNHCKSWKYYKSCYFKIVFHLSYKNAQRLFFVTVFFNIFMRQTLTDDFLGQD